jgi:hypothetical protein
LPAGAENLTGRNRIGTVLPQRDDATAEPGQAARLARALTGPPDGWPRAIATADNGTDEAENEAASGRQPPD